MGIRSIHDEIRTVEMHAKNREQLEHMPVWLSRWSRLFHYVFMQLTSQKSNSG